MPSRPVLQRTPRLYRSAAKLAKQVKEEGASLKDTIYNCNIHPNVKGLFALVTKALSNYEVLEVLLKKTNLLSVLDRHDPWLVRILVTELLWGKKSLSGASRAVQEVQNLQQELLTHLGETSFTSKKVTKPRYVRVNTLLKSVEEVKSAFVQEDWCCLETPVDYGSFLEEVYSLGEYDFIQDYHMPELLVFHAKSSLHCHSLTLNGTLVLQDKSSCLVGKLLSPPPGSVVLDMCAAPGLKAVHIAALMNNEGVVHACEIHPRRCESLKNVVQQTRATCIKVMNRDALSVKREEVADVKFILVDVPCSGSGMVDRYDYKLTRDMDEERLSKLRGLQAKLLKRALRNFPSAQRVVYSTCSINTSENEGVISDVIEAGDIKKSFNLIDCSSILGDDFNKGSSEFEFGHKCIYMSPENDFTNGFFMAMFERKSNSTEEEYKDSRIKVTKKGKSHGISKSMVNASSSENTSHAPTESNDCEMIEPQDSQVKKKIKKHKSKDGMGDIFNLENASHAPTESQDCSMSEPQVEAENGSSQKKIKKRKSKDMGDISSSEKTSQTPTMNDGCSLIETKNSSSRKKVKKRKSKDCMGDISNLENASHAPTESHDCSMSEPQDSPVKKKVKKRKSKTNQKEDKKLSFTEIGEADELDFSQYGSNESTLPIYFEETPEKVKKHKKKLKKSRSKNLTSDANFSANDTTLLIDSDDSINRTKEGEDGLISLPAEELAVGEKLLESTEAAFDSKKRDKKRKKVKVLV